MNDNLHIDPQHVRNLATGLTTIANTPVTSTFLPGETMLGVGKFISAFNAAVDSVTLRAASNAPTLMMQWPKPSTTCGLSRSMMQP